MRSAPALPLIAAHRINLGSETDFKGWRVAARDLLTRNVRPEDVVWEVAVAKAAEPDLENDNVPAASSTLQFSVPRAFVDLAEQAILHSDPERFALLYCLLFRLRTERKLMEIAVDPLVARLAGLTKSVRRDIHKMHAFVRFRAVATGEGEHFIAWFEPDHHIVEAASTFFQRRFAAMRWSILTPEKSVHWTGEALIFGAGATRAEAPGEDALEDLWRSYYASIFNPARLKIGMMRSEMPEKYWKNLPEARLIKPLSNQASALAARMVAAPAQEPNLRPQRWQTMQNIEEKPVNLDNAASLGELRKAALACRNCPLWEPATQTVFGEGPQEADIVFVGEQPGDSEDLAGRPFIGPAGQLFDKALGEAGIDRGRIYVTNAVKHFKFEPRGKRRIHQKPTTGEIRACRPWLVRELELLSPKLVVALGATAIQGITGKAMPVNANRGRAIETPGGPPMLVTVHPSYLLRLPDEAAKRIEYARFCDDLRLVSKIVGV